MIELPPIPDKEFFSIGETSRIAQLPAYVLRYWESEFKALRPARRNSGQRKYTRKDIELLFTIKDLLYARKFTIAGARKHILEEKRKKEPEFQLNMDIAVPSSSAASSSDNNPGNPEAIRVLTEAKKELEEILKLLR